MTDKQEPSISLDASNSPPSDRLSQVALKPSPLPFYRSCAMAPRPRPIMRNVLCQDDLAPVTGIVASVLITGLIWAILIWIVQRASPPMPQHRGNHATPRPERCRHRLQPIDGSLISASASGRFHFARKPMMGWRRCITVLRRRPRLSSNSKVARRTAP